MSADPSARRGIPDATVARLPEYLRALTGLAERGHHVRLLRGARRRRRGALAKLRKDLSHLGSYGVRGVGYEVDHLAYQISRELGLTQDWPVAIVGMGNLGHALAAYSGFATRGFRVVALLDQDPTCSARRSPACAVQPMTELAVAGQPTRAWPSGSSPPRPPRRRTSATARRGRRALDPQLRALRARRPRRRRRPQGRPVHRAADPRLPRAAQGARGAASPCAKVVAPVSLRRPRPVPPHRAPAPARGRVARRRRPRLRWPRASSAARTLSEAIVVSTCNRTEVYAEAHDLPRRRHRHRRRAHRGHRRGPRGPARAPLRPLRGPGHRPRLHGRLRAGLDGRRRGPDPRPDAHRPARAGQRAGHAGPSLNALFQQALRVGKRAHTETGIDAVSVSLVEAGLAHAERELGPPARTCRSSSSAPAA